MLGLCVMLLSAASATAWPGHQWEAWAEITTWSKPDIKTAQSGKKELIGLLATAEGGIDEIAGWETRREE